MVLQQVHSLRTVADRYKNKLGSIKLELFTSPNFIGLFVGEEDAAVVKQMVASFAAELSTYGTATEFFVNIYLASRVSLEKHQDVHVLLSAHEYLNEKMMTLLLLLF